MCTFCPRLFAAFLALFITVPLATGQDAEQSAADQPFVLLGVNCESQQVLDRLINDGTVTWRTWADGNGGPIAQQWNVSGFPTIALIDHNGILRWRSSGVPEISELTKMVEQLIAEVQP